MVNVEVRKCIMSVWVLTRIEVQTCELMHKHTNSHFSHVSLIADIKVKRVPYLKHSAALRGHNKGNHRVIFMHLAYQSFIALYDFQSV